MKNILSPQSSLLLFFEQVGLASNFGNHNKEKRLYMPAKTCLPLEEHARSVLTSYAF
ncbi:hypothetical protein A4A49_57332, partial [Nicotiana attenuata]